MKLTQYSSQHLEELRQSNPITVLNDFDVQKIKESVSLDASELPQNAAEDELLTIKVENKIWPESAASSSSSLIFKVKSVIPTIHINKDILNIF